MTRVTFVTPEEFRGLEDKRLALAHARSNDREWLRANNSTYGWARIDEVGPQCLMWYTPWYFDPSDPEDKPKRDRALEALRNGTFDKSHQYLSRFYWQDWSHKRPPICVLTPNGKEWCVDACSSNGEGWQVTGEPPSITCEPSIQVTGYHGYLRNGEFTPPL